MAASQWHTVYSKIDMVPHIRTWNMRPIGPLSNLTTLPDAMPTPNQNYDMQPFTGTIALWVNLWYTFSWAWARIKGWCSIG